MQLIEVRLKMTNTFMPNIKTEEELKTHQLKGLQWTVQHAYEGSPVYRARLDEKRHSSPRHSFPERP